MRIPLTLFAILAVAACATKSEDIQPSYISPVQYQSFSCRQIGEEASRVSSRAAAASGRQDQIASNDAAKTAVGLVVLWPVLLFNKGDGETASEVGRLKGEMEALEKASIGKNCGIKFNNAPVKSVAAPAAEPKKAASFSKKP